MISSYPRASRSQCSGQILFGLGAQTLEKPSEWRQASIPFGPGLWARLHKYWASPNNWCILKKGLGLMLLGPTPLTWTVQDKWRLYQCGPALVAQFCSLGTVPKTTPISEFHRDVFSKRNRAIFPTSGNFQNYLFN